MAKYLKKFETAAQYTAAQSSLILPNVSLITENNKVEYNPLTPPTPSYDFVEIGGIKWATMNIGANSVTDAGLYFQWGDTQGYTAAQVGSGEGQKYFDNEFADYKFYEDGGMTKYNNEDDLTVLQPSDDSVTAAWGGNWRMPTNAEFRALLTATTSAWNADYEGSGVAGVVLTDNDDNSKTLFFPACGHADDGSVSGVGSLGYYWSSSLDLENYFGADMAICSETGMNVTYDYGDIRHYGHSVRGVLDV
jgi:hypothetical protein